MFSVRIHKFTYSQTHGYIQNYMLHGLMLKTYFFDLADASTLKQTRAELLK